MDNLVFCEPYIEHARNTFPELAAEDVAAIRADADILRLVGRMRRRYVTGAEALIHGDLHTGSVMVSGSSCKVIDCEFSAYGPVAWDLGQLAGNLLTAVVRAQVVGQDPAEIAAMVPRLWECFAAELRRLWAGRTDLDMTDAFLEDWLAELEPDARRFAACEILRRVIGNIVDFAALDESLQGVAACGLLRIARAVLLGADRLDWAQCAAMARDALTEVSAGNHGGRT
jgi:5-methylthioribose kinase